MDVGGEGGVGVDVRERQVGGVRVRGDGHDQRAGEQGDAAGFVVEDVRGGGGEDGVRRGREVRAQGEEVALGV